MFLGHAYLFHPPRALPARIFTVEIKVMEGLSENLVQYDNENDK